MSFRGAAAGGLFFYVCTDAGWVILGKYEASQSQQSLVFQLGVCGGFLTVPVKRLLMLTGEAISTSSYLRKQVASCAAGHVLH